MSSDRKNNGIFPTVLFAAKTLLAVAVLTSALPAAAQNANSANNGAAALKKLQDMFKAAGSAKNNKQFCAIVVTQAGQLKSSPDNQMLSSKLMGGQPGTADVYATNGSYAISIDPVTGFSTQPAGGSANTTFSSDFSATGSTSFADTPGNIPQKLKQGTTQVETNFIATRTPDPFPAGNYSGELVLRCE